MTAAEDRLRASVLDDAPWVVPSRVIRALKAANPIFDGYAQQDAHEVSGTAESRVLFLSRLVHIDL